MKGYTLNPKIKELLRIPVLILLTIVKWIVIFIIGLHLLSWVLITFRTFWMTVVLTFAFLLPVIYPITKGVYYALMLLGIWRRR